MEKETSDEMVRMKARNFISLIVSVVLITNSFSIIYQKVLRNEENDTYNRERAERYADRKKTEAIQEIEMLLLNEALDNCRNNK